LDGDQERFAYRPARMAFLEFIPSSARGALARSLRKVCPRF
jgi:hypothetical protein